MAAASLYPIELPYGLSRYHAHLQTSDNGEALPLGDLGRFCRPSLAELCARSLPFASSRCPSTHSLLADARYEIYKEKMKLLFAKKRIMLTAMAKERRTRTPKPKIIPTSRPMRTQRRKSRTADNQSSQAPFGQRAANAQDAIVIEDSDEDEDMAEGTPPFVTAPSSPEPSSQIEGNTNWLRDSMRSTPIRATVDLGQYRITHDAPIDLTQDDDLNRTTLPFKRQVSVSQISVRSIERQPSEVIL
jgi:hypothetical protein